jgi:hypothetical protein
MRRYRSMPVSDEQRVLDFGQPNIISQCGALQENHRFAVQYFVDDEDVARKFGHVVSGIQADLVDLAASVYMADRLEPRPRTNSCSAPWRRSLTLTVPVRCVSAWRRPAVQRSLLDILHFLTEDKWNIQFSSRPEARRVSETQPFLFTEPFNGPVKVALYSGGLSRPCVPRSGRRSPSCCS